MNTYTYTYANGLKVTFTYSPRLAQDNAERLQDKYNKLSLDF